MIISLNWLKDMVDLSGLSTDEIVEKITLSTAEVEEVKKVGDDMEDVVIAKVVTCEKIPDTHLNLLSVDDGREVLQIATGAPNVYAGMKTALVRVGGKVEGRKIKKAKLAGYDSFGMCCSEAELGIGSDDDGIVDFTNSGYNVGTDLKSILPIEDTLVEIDNKSLTNRPDLWGHLGFARELSAIFNRELKKIDLVDLHKLNGLPKLNNEVLTKDCLRYTALRVENVTKKVSPSVMKIRLNYCGLRDINLITDLTNYIMLELGQPMHAFDSSIVNGVVVRPAKENEKLVTLEGEEHEIPVGATLICDKSDTPVAIAGIKGGMKSGISEDTTGFLLESAVFTASSVRKASKAIKLSTDASNRYEKSLDPNLTDIAIARLVSLLRDIDGDIIISSDLYDYKNYDQTPKKIEISTSFIRKRIGEDISDEFIVATLKSLGFVIEKEEDGELEVKVPSFRATKDITIKEDLVEEIARMYGYDKIVPKKLNFDLEPVEQDPIHINEYKTKRLLAEKYGVSEVHSYIWNYSDFNASVNIKSNSYINLVDTSNSGQSGIRSELAPTLIKFFYENKNNFDDIKMEEIGRVITGIGEDGRAIEEKHLCVLIANGKKDVENYFELKKMIENIALSLARVTLVYEDTTEEKMLPSARTAISVNGEKIGVMGVLHPAIVSKLDTKMSVAYLEADFNKLMQFTNPQITYKKVSKYQTVDMDFNFLVPTSVTYAKIEEMLKLFRCKFNVSYKLKDVYENKQVLGDNKAMTINFAISSNEHTLSAGEIESFRKRLLDHMKNNGIELR